MVMVLAFRPGGTGSNLVRTLYFCHAFIHFLVANFARKIKLKKFADDNVQFNKNGRESSRRVENIAGKEENARYEQFLLFPQCFQNTCTVGTYKPGLVWERAKVRPV